MDGVTTAIVLFIFVCVLFPRLIDNRAQYYAALGCAILIILIEASVHIFGYNRVEAGPAGSGMAVVQPNGYSTFAHVAVALLQVVSILLLFLSAGGLTVRGLTREMAGAFEVIRRGETEKEIIIPVGGSKGEPRKRAIDTAGEPPQRFDLSAEAAAGASYPAKKPAAAPGMPPRDDGPLPLD